MDGTVKQLFGVMMLGGRRLDAGAHRPGALRCCCGRCRPPRRLAVVDARRPRAPGRCAFGLRSAGRSPPVLYGAALAAGAALGDADPLAPLPLAARSQTMNCLPRASSRWRIWSARSRRPGRRARRVLLDFSADWCVSCKEMERYTFTEPAVQAALRERCCCGQCHRERCG